MLDITAFYTLVYLELRSSVENPYISAGDINLLFGRELARTRQAKNMSQSALAGKVGVSRATIANLEGGRQNVLLHQVFALATSLDVTPNVLIPEMPAISSDAASKEDQMFLTITKAHLNAVLGGNR